jgi:ferredoxin-NADP reductase
MWHSIRRKGGWPAKEEASFDRDIRREVESSHFQGFIDFARRGHYYEHYLTSTKGRITARYIEQTVAGGVLDKNMFLCGPSPMVGSLIEQFKELGVEETRIIVEAFNLI